MKYYPSADLIWMKTATPNLEEARHFAKSIRAKFSNQMLTCSHTTCLRRSTREWYDMKEYVV